MVSAPTPSTFAMVVGLKPISANRGANQRYTSQLQRAALAKGAQILTGPLYARITWFQLRRSQGDVDNIAKRILDSLKGVVIQDDDDVIRCLIQETVADSTGNFAFDALGIPSATALAILQSLLGVEDHVLCIEVGPVVEPTVYFGPVL